MWLKRGQSLLKGESGATAVEYAVMLALIVIVAIGAIQLLGAKVNNAFQSTVEELEGTGG